TKRRGTLFDLDVVWGKGNEAVRLRLVGYAHSSKQIRWYLTTVPRYMLSAPQVIETYRLRWLIEFLFRELKQNADLGRSFTANSHAIEALTYGAMLAHVLVRSLRIEAALRNEIPIEQLRPLACLHVARAFARDIVDALASCSRTAFADLLVHMTPTLLAIAREQKTVTFAHENFPHTRGCRCLSDRGWGGAAYDPATDTWRLIGVEGYEDKGEVTARAIWSGARALFWNVPSDGDAIATQYDPTEDRWHPISLEGAPIPSAGVAWTGAEMLAWGYNGEGGYVSGGAYDPTTDSWRALSIAG